MGILLALFIGYSTILVVVIGILESFGFFGPHGFGLRTIKARLKGLFRFSKHPSLSSPQQDLGRASGPVYVETPVAQTGNEAGKRGHEGVEGGHLTPDLREASLSWKEDDTGQVSSPEDPAKTEKSRGIRPIVSSLGSGLGSLGRWITFPFIWFWGGGRNFGRSLALRVRAFTPVDLKKAGLRLLGGFIFAFCLIAVAGEMYFRMKGPTYSEHKYLYRWHPSAGYALNRNYHYRPGKIRRSDRHDFKTTTNSYGFRSRDISFKKKGYRIMMLGDSFTFGTGTADEETTSWILEDILRVTPGYEKVEILNAGTNGSSNVSQINYFRSDGVAFAPDLVVLNLYTGNDFDQNLQDSRGVVTCFRYGLMQAHTNPEDFIARTGWYASPDKTTSYWIYLKPSLWQGVDEFLHGKFWLYREVSDRLLNLRPMQSILYRLGQIQFKIGSQERVNVHQTRTMEAGRRYTEEMLTQFRDYLNSKGIKFLIHIIPIKSEVRGGRLSPFRQEFRNNTEAFMKFLKEQRIPYIYDAPVFEENELWFDLTYNALYGHYTPQDNQVSAATLYRTIAQEVLQISKDNQDRALTRVVAEDIPLTRSETFFTKSTDPVDIKGPGYTSVSRKDVESLKYEPPGTCTFGGGPMTYDKDTFEADLFNPRAERVYYYPGAAWGYARVDFDIVLKQRMNLYAVVADVPAIYPNFSTTKMVVYNTDTKEPLAGAIMPRNSWELCARNIGTVQKFRISLFRYSTSNTICLRGFRLLYKR